MNGIIMFFAVTLLFLCFSSVSSFAVRPNNSNNNSPPPTPRHRLPVEEVVAQQLALLQQGGDLIEQAFDDFFCFEAQVESDNQGFVETLQNDDAFRPLAEPYRRATAVLVVQDPDPTRCSCLVQVVVSRECTRTLDYWWTMRLEESLVSDRGILVRSRPGSKAVWKVESIEPAFESLDWESSIAGYLSNPFDMEEDEEITFFEQDGASQAGLQELLEMLEYDAEDDGVDSFDEENFMIPIQYYGRSTDTNDEDDMNDKFRMGTLVEDENGNFIVKLNDESSEGSDDKINEG